MLAAASVPPVLRDEAVQVQVRTTLRTWREDLQSLFEAGVRTVPLRFKCLKRVDLTFFGGPQRVRSDEVVCLTLMGELVVTPSSLNIMEETLYQSFSAACAAASPAIDQWLLDAPSLEVRLPADLTQAYEEVRLAEVPPEAWPVKGVRPPPRVRVFVSHHHLPADRPLQLRLAADRGNRWCIREEVPLRGLSSVTTRLFSLYLPLDLLGKHAALCRLLYARLAGNGAVSTVLSYCNPVMDSGTSTVDACETLGPAWVKAP